MDAEVLNQELKIEEVSKPPLSFYDLFHSRLANLYEEDRIFIKKFTETTEELEINDDDDEEEITKERYYTSYRIYFPKLQVFNYKNNYNYYIKDFYLEYLFYENEDDDIINLKLQGYRTTFNVIEYSNQFIHPHINPSERYFCTGSGELAIVYEDFRTDLSKLKYNQENIDFFLNFIDLAIREESPEGGAYKYYFQLTDNYKIKESSNILIDYIIDIFKVQNLQIPLILIGNEIEVNPLEFKSIILNLYETDEEIKGSYIRLLDENNLPLELNWLKIDQEYTDLTNNPDGTQYRLHEKELINLTILPYANNRLSYSTQFNEDKFKELLKEFNSRIRRFFQNFLS